MGVIPINFDQVRNTLKDSPDEVVARLANKLGAVFGRPGLHPPLSAWESRADLAARVDRSFPPQFALSFHRWRDDCVTFEAAIQDGDAAQVSRAFAVAFDGLYDLWKRVLDFCPFVFMLSANRLNRDAVRLEAEDELAQAMGWYQAFYYTPADQQKESDQRKLLESLLSLFRTLCAKRVPGPEFPLQPLLHPPEDFTSFIPVRFEHEIRLIQEVRNDVVHHELGKRDRTVLEWTHQLLGWCFCDIVVTLCPLFEYYELVYITAIGRDGEQLVADGYSFSGSVSPATVRFALPDARQADVDAVTEGQLFLIKRGRRLSDAGAPLLPPDYLNLTPLLVYEWGRRQPGAVRQPDPGATRELFVFRQYAEKAERATFRELTGSYLLTVTPQTQEDLPPADRQALVRLYREVVRFRKDVVALSRGLKKLTRSVDPAVLLPELRTRTWDASLEHLATVLDVERYDETGTFRSGASTTALKGTFREDLFVPPQEAADVQRFISSSQHALVVVGGSGSGKSNLLSHFFLTQRRAGEVNLFFSGRQIDDPAFDKYLEKILARTLDGRPLPQLTEWLKGAGTRLTIYVDAVNEYNRAEGPLRLIEQLLTFVRHRDAGDVRFIVSCRTETWAQFRERVRFSMSAEHFFNADGLKIGSFDSEADRRALFAAYQQHFRLTPDSYDRLSPSVRSLIRYPFIMSLVAEAYANGETGEAGAAGPVRVPQDLNYFRLFQELTRRKLSDARQLLSRDDPRWDQFLGELRDCLLTFSTLLFENLTAAQPSNTHSPARESSDALHLDALTKDARFQRFRPKLGEGMSAFEALLQVSLIETIFVSEPDFFTSERQGRAYKFFHDQYTQFSLAAVYQTGVPGRVPPALLRDEPAVARLRDQVLDLIQRSVDAPVLLGALEHWLYANLPPNPSRGDDLALPLLNLLAEHKSGGARYFASSFLMDLVRRDIVSPDVLFPIVCRDGGPALLLNLAESFIESWPGVAPEIAASFINSIDESSQDDVLKRLADIFALHFAAEPEAVAQYFDSALYSLGGVSDVAGAIFRRETVGRQATFLMHFVNIALLANFSSERHMGILRDFLSRKYSWLFDVLIDRPIRASHLVKDLTDAGLRQWVYARIDAVGMAQGRQFLSVEASASGFRETPGVVQRDVWVEFVPYAVALHNGQTSLVSLAPGAPFRTLVMKMLNYRVCSAIGYLAAVSLPTLLVRDWAAVEAMIDDLIAEDTDSGRFFASLLLINLAYSDPELAHASLKLLRHRVIPWTLSHGKEYDWPTLACLCIAAPDVEKNWEPCKAALEDLFAYFDGRDEPTVSKLGDDLLKCSFCADVTLGERVIELLLDRGGLTDPRWIGCTRKVLAGLLARDPEALERLLERRGVPTQILDEVRTLVDQKMLWSRDAHIYQTSWNRAINVALMSNVKLRYLLIKELVAGLPQSDAEKDWGLYFRRFVVGVIKAYFGDQRAQDPANYAHISLAPRTDAL